MALNPGFHQWLSGRGLQLATITALQKESILQESTLKLLSDSDLETLKKKYNITVGQFALLRSVRGDLHEADEDGFELVEELEVLIPVDEDVKDESSASTGNNMDKNSTSAGVRHRAKQKGQGTKGLLSDNLDKAAHRERNLQDVAVASENMVSSADEFSRLTALLAEKKRRESGKKLLSWRMTRSSSSSGTPPSLPAKASSLAASNYDHLDPLPASSKTYVHSPDQSDGSDSRNLVINTGDEHHDTSDDERDGNSKCCNVM